MKEKRKQRKHSKEHKSKSKKREKRRHSSSSASSSSSSEWVEKKSSKGETEREDWMSMTGVLKTYTKEDIHQKKEQKEKKSIDSYNPGTSSRELNPYWKDGGSGLPQTSENFRKSRQFLKPEDSDDYYTKSSMKSSYKDNKKDNDSSRHNTSYYDKSSNWKKRDEKCDDVNSRDYKREAIVQKLESSINNEKVEKEQSSKYLSDEKMNKLAAKIVKAEIMGDTKVVAELKAKLEAAREYRKQNPKPQIENNNDDAVMLISTNSSGNSRPLINTTPADPRSRSGKRKAETYVSGERAKYFGNDDKYNLAQMFENEKYGNNYDDDAELARIASKHKNPNDDLEDIFVDEISKNRNDAKDKEVEKQRAINQHVKMERTIEGCEYCLESKNMLKHLMVSCGNKVYLALPSRKSLVKDHCFISTIQHASCVTALDEDVWEEILDYRKALTQFYGSQNMDVVFYETAIKLNRNPHLVINCVPMPRDVGDTAPIYFKKALLECEGEWSMNKKVVDLKGKNIRRGIPKGLPYFWVDFGMDPGFAHVIEDQQIFPKTFAEEIIAGILDLDHSHWKNTKKDFGDVQRKKVLEFIKEWKPFDLKNKQ